MKHLQIILEEKEYRVLKLVSVQEDVSIKELTYDAVMNHCLAKLGKATLDEAAELLNLTKEN